MFKWLQQIIDIVLPPRCLLCGKILSGENGLCDKCFSKISFIGSPICLKCGNPLPSGRNAKSCPQCVSDGTNPFRLQRSRVRYDDESRPLLINFKFHDKTENAAFLARWLFACGHDIWEQGADVLIPVPLHKARLRHRRYNQSALLCKELSRLTGIPAEYNVLIKHKQTKPQAECLGRERRRNLSRAFSVKYPERIKGKRVVLVDDIMTTGSTLRECAETLLKHEVMSVDALTVARVCKAA